MKPVAAGVDPAAAVNADVAALRGRQRPGAAGRRNPFAFAPAIAPHVAAAAGRAIELDRSGRPTKPCARRRTRRRRRRRRRAGAAGEHATCSTSRARWRCPSSSSSACGSAASTTRCSAVAIRAAAAARRLDRQPHRSGDGRRRRKPGDAGSPACGAALGRPGVAAGRRRVAAATDASGRVASDARRHARKLSRRAGFSANAEKPG